MTTKNQSKYHLQNGILTLNPYYSPSDSGNKTSALPQPPPTARQIPIATATATALPVGENCVLPLAIVSSQDDISLIHELQVGHGLPAREEEIPLSTLNTIREMQTPEYSSYFKNSNNRNLFEELCVYFIRYEVPIGLLTKLLVLKNYRLNFMVDDSGSMGSITDVKFKEATEYVQDGSQSEKFLTRWQEAENRLHIMIDILAYIPPKHIQICFMNNVNHTLILSHTNKTPEMFQQEYHRLISVTFKSLQLGRTPTLRTLTRGFQEASQYEEPTSHYLLTDGVPTDSSIEQVSQLIQNRPLPHRNPLTLISCTNEDSECEWMKIIEEIAPFTAEIDDYNSEKKEVITEQGSAFPYTKGLWLLSNLIAALNPDDLDALDESLPFSKHTLDEMLGRYHTPEEYSYYFQHNPHSSYYQQYFPELSTIPQVARKIIPLNQIKVPNGTLARKGNVKTSFIDIVAAVLVVGLLCWFGYEISRRF